MPHFLFTYANDQQSQLGYLRALARERKCVKSATDLAEDMGLCRRIFIDDASIGDIVNAFQRHGEEIVLFHYGGHADSFDLLLQSDSGESNEATGGAGLISFLGRQRGLQVVVLNGCHSLPLAESLIAAGISVVIGTDRAINDGAATLWADRFYQGLGVGLSIQRAFDDAVDTVRMSSHGRDQRGLYLRELESIPSDVPWSILHAPAQEDKLHWSLTQVDPLLGLPEPVQVADLPDPPFLFFRRYDRAHAPVFFGRARHIRLLYDRIANPDSPPLILLHGQSGSGKSSLFEAGLVPRLEADYQVVYLRRNAQIGLHQTLLQTLRAMPEEKKPVERPTPDPELRQLLQRLEQLLQDRPQDRALQQQLQGVRTLMQRGLESIPQNPAYDHFPPLLRIWHRIEARHHRPLIVILDQVEEVFVQPDKHSGEAEWTAFVAGLRELFGSIADRPAGKMILGFRKEFYPEVEKALQEAMLPRSGIFLPTLNRSEIEEIVKGLTSRRDLRERYQLQIDEELPGIISGELLPQEEATVAPILQIMLTNMWEAARAEAPHRPHFTVELYRQLKKQWWQLDKFVAIQMDQVAVVHPQAVANGLLLDILYQHTTAGNTAQSNSPTELRAQYQHVPGLDQLLQSCTHHLLLKSSAAGSSLSHDTLAPIVQRMFRQSDRPGQRARRILEGRVQETADAIPPPLDRYDLDQVAQGRAYMRTLQREEQELVTRSKAAEMKRRRQRNVLFGILALLGIAAVGGLVYGNQEKANRLVIQGNLDVLQEKSDSLSGQIEVQDLQLHQTESQLAQQQDALRLLEDSAQLLLQTTQETERRAVAAERLFRANQSAANALAYLQEGKKYEALRTAVAAYEQAPASPAVLGALLATAYDTGAILQPMQTGYQLVESTSTANGYGLSDINDFEFKVIDGSGRTRYRHPETGFQDEPARFIAGYADRAYFSMNGAAQIVIWEPVISLDRKVQDLNGPLIGLRETQKSGKIIWATENGQMGMFAGQVSHLARNNSIRNMDLSEQGTLLICQELSLQLMGMDNLSLIRAIQAEHSGLAFQRAVFSPGGRYISAAQSLGQVSLYDSGTGALRQTFKTAADNTVPVRGTIFSPDERYVLGWDNTRLFIWNWQEGRLLHQQTFPAEINVLSFSPDGRQLLLGSADRNLYIFPWQGGKTNLSTDEAVIIPLAAGVVDLFFWKNEGTKLAVAAGPTVHFYDWQRQLPLGNINMQEQIRTMLVTADGQRLWVGTDKSLKGPIWLDPRILVTKIKEHINPK
ncbi:MAG: AAA family ATPase [Saprospiraceae bacterium]|nr:AAA family ATPase [Lewinella sp.]